MVRIILSRGVRSIRPPRSNLVAQRYCLRWTAGHAPARLLQSEYQACSGSIFRVFKWLVRQDCQTYWSSRIRSSCTHPRSQCRLGKILWTWWLASPSCWMISWGGRTNHRHWAQTTLGVACAWRLESSSQTFVSRSRYSSCGSTWTWSCYNKRKPQEWVCLSLSHAKQGS